MEQKDKVKELKDKEVPSINDNDIFSNVLSVLDPNHKENDTIPKKRALLNYLKGIVISFKKNIAKFKKWFSKWVNPFVAIFVMSFAISFLYLFFIVNTTYQWLPDYFSLYKIKDPNSYFDLIISSLSSLSGILIAVLLIAFQMLRDRLSRNAQKYFFRNKQLMFITILFTTTITIAFFSKILILDIPLNNILNVIYLNVFLFVISILTIIPLSISVLFSLDITKIINSEIQKITFGENYFFAAMPNFQTGLGFDKRKEEFPIYLLREIALKNMSNGSSIPKAISRETILKLLEILENHIDKNGRINMHFSFKGKPGATSFVRKLDFFKCYIDLITAIKREAIKTQSKETLDSLNYDLLALYQRCLELKIHPLELQGVNDFFESYFYELIKHRHHDIIQNGISIYCKIIIEVLDSIAPKENKLQDIYDFYKLEGEVDKDYEAEKIWSLIERMFIGFLSRLMNHSVELKDIKTFNLLISFSTSLLYDINKMDSLGSYQKNDLIVKIQSILGSEIIDAIEGKKFPAGISVNAKGMYNLYVNNTLKIDNQFMFECLRITGEYTIGISKTEEFDRYMLLKFIAYVNLIIKRYTESTNYEKAFIYCLDVLNILRKHMELDLIKNEVNFQELKAKTELLIKYAKENQLVKPYRKLKKMNKKFKSIPKFK